MRCFAYNIIDFCNRNQNSKNQINRIIISHEKRLLYNFPDIVVVLGPFSMPRLVVATAVQYLQTVMEPPGGTNLNQIFVSALRQFYPAAAARLRVILK